MTPDHDTLREWLDLEVDGALEEDQAEILRDHLSACAACQAENRDLAGLVGLLASSRVDVRAGFREDVMRGLPAPAWLPAAGRAYGLVAALFGALVVTAAVLANLAQTGGASPGPLGGILLALAGLAQSSVLATAGLLGASWQGVGMALSELWSNSPIEAVMLGVGIVLLDIVFLRLLTRTRRSLGAAPASRSRRSG